MQRGVVGVHPSIVRCSSAGWPRRARRRPVRRPARSARRPGCATAAAGSAASRPRPGRPRPGDLHRPVDISYSRYVSAPYRFAHLVRRTTLAATCPSCRTHADRSTVPRETRGAVGGRCLHDLLGGTYVPRAVGVGVRLDVAWFSSRRNGSSELTWPRSNSTLCQNAITAGAAPRARRRRRTGRRPPGSAGPWWPGPCPSSSARRRVAERSRCSSGPGSAAGTSRNPPHCGIVLVSRRYGFSPSPGPARRHPVLRSGQRGSGLAVRGVRVVAARRVDVDLRQHHRSWLVRQRHRTVLVVHDRERLAQ